MKAAELYATLWQCATLADVMDVLKSVKHAHRSIGERRNNIAPIHAGRDSIAAIIEGVTNAHDAVIRVWTEMGKFSPQPRSVAEALEQITKGSQSGRRVNAPVHVNLQLNKGTAFEKAHAVTIVDSGIGLTEQGMLAGPLNFGSEDKVLDPLQFGRFGQGGSSLYRFCDCSLIASRRYGSDIVTFAIVWLDRPAGKVPSYVYLTKPDGSLFSFDAVDLLDQAVSPSHQVHATLALNIPIIPDHGTVRRQLNIQGVDEYYTQRGTSLYHALSDRLFGCPAFVQMAGDDNPGHLNNRRGRRCELNAVAVGECLPRRAAKLRAHFPPSPLTIKRRQIPVGQCKIELWVIDNWLNKGGIATPARHLLEGPDRGVPTSILLTVNTQTHARLPSTGVFSRAGLREIAENIIIEVTLDQLPVDVLHDVLMSNREGVATWFEKEIATQIERYLNQHDELKLLIKDMAPPEQPSEREFSLAVNKVLRDPLIGQVLGYQINGHAAKQGHVDVVKAAERKAPKVIELHDPPTWIEVRKSTVVRNDTNWITIHTDAKDHYDNKLEIMLPKFLKQVERGELRNGRLTLVTQCNNSTRGTTGFLIARLRTPHSSRIEERREITVVPRSEEYAKRPPKEMALGKGDGNLGNQDGPPETKLYQLSGAGEEGWASFFGAASDPAEAAINYYMSKDDNTVKVGLHTGFPPLDGTRRHLEAKYGAAIGRDFYQRVCHQLQVSALVFCRNPSVGEFGAQDGDAIRLLTDIARTVIVNTSLLYRNSGFRRNVIASVKDDE